MEINLASWLAARTPAPRPVAPENALPGRTTDVLTPIPPHAVLGLPLDAEPGEVAYFALGCYWGAERLFWEAPGVVNTAVGFMGGYTPNPTYMENCTGLTGHAETVKVVFDPNETSFAELLRLFWENHDPTQGYRQGNDVGTHYRSAVFPVDDQQRREAEASRDAFQAQLTEAGYGTITTEIAPGQVFYFAEDEHQQYLHKNPDGYACSNRTGVSCPL